CGQSNLTDIIAPEVTHHVFGNGYPPRNRLCSWSPRRRRFFDASFWAAPDQTDHPFRWSLRPLPLVLFECERRARFGVHHVPVQACSRAARIGTDSGHRLHGEEERDEVLE